ncbi:MAG: SLBB domain-containing protein, partial [candidate division Zixibacteria bacterium]|nr:SLBB domain-containing protein [candidate division Zixibacteria bacterium]
MKARLILFAFVLILVSIYWFNRATAQSLPANLTDQEKAELYLKYKSSGATGVPVGSGESNRYSSPLIFDAAEESRSGSLHSLLASGKMRTYDIDSPFAREDEGDKKEKLKPFGLELFERAGQLSSPTEIASFDDYVLGPGDNILIFLWGRVEKEFNLTVDRQGSLHIPRIGEISVWGQKLSDFEKALKIKLKQAYSEFDFTITLGKIRSIRVYVIGEVKNPGAYTVSSLTTLFNVLYQAGGPNERGSMRSIKLLRGGQNIT